jgi:hypothetical protein
VWWASLYYVLLLTNFEYSLHLVKSQFRYKCASCDGAANNQGWKHYYSFFGSVPTFEIIKKMVLPDMEFILHHIKDESLRIQSENNNLNSVSQIIWPVTSLNLYWNFLRKSVNYMRISTPIIPVQRSLTRHKVTSLSVTKSNMVK